MSESRALTVRLEAPVSLERLFDRLAQLREGLPPIDAAAVAAEGRAALEHRGES
jgi:hypothetical protein